MKTKIAKRRYDQSEKGLARSRRRNERRVLVGYYDDERRRPKYLHFARSRFSDAQFAAIKRYIEGIRNDFNDRQRRERGDSA